MLKSLFDFKKDEEFLRLNILGIKINKRYKKPRKNKSNGLGWYIQSTMQCLASTHSQIFPQFEYKYKEREIVIVGTGPTLKYYVPIEDAVHIGLNRAYQFDKVKMDYLFMIDGTAVKDYIDDADKLVDVIRFYGVNLLKEEYREGIRIPDYHFMNKNTYKFYYTQYYKEFIYPNIAYYPLFNRATVAFPALHFALYTHPKRIYLVGCDTTAEPYWDGGKREEQYLEISSTINEKIIKGYVELKKFADICYPDIEIVSVNPVGLKGLFRDIYTEEYSKNLSE